MQAYRECYHVWQYRRTQAQQGRYVSEGFFVSDIC